MENARNTPSQSRANAMEMINLLESFKRLNITTNGYLCRVIDGAISEYYSDPMEIPPASELIDVFDLAIGDITKAIEVIDQEEREFALQEKARLYDELTKPGGELERLRELENKKNRIERMKASYKQYVESGKQAEDTQKASEAIENVIMTPFEVDPDDDEVYRSHQVNE